MLSRLTYIISHIGILFITKYSSSWGIAYFVYLFALSQWVFGLCMCFTCSDNTTVTINVKVLVWSYVCISFRYMPRIGIT